MSRLLPRFTAGLQRIEDMQKLARILLEADGDDTTAQPGNGNGGGRQAPGSTAPGDRARLRGVPIYSKGVGGAVRGSLPHRDAPSLRGR